ncbi:MAG: Zn-ribbon domain-containing OB-fold protein [Pseudooceanicola nanhaiensis]|uniref:Zn-ribbon domain-containing OB-fold protein n=1 Tax=Rhodobacterales TaxID=204455 RepID=UPI0040591E45
MTIDRPAALRGLYDDVFWASLAEGAYRLQQCGGCGHVRYPPGPCCPACLSEDATWLAVSGHGTVISWTRFHRKYFDGIPPPYLVVSVRLAEGAMVIGNFAAPPEVTPIIGQPVRLRLEPTIMAGAPALIPNWAPAPTQPDLNPREE